MFFSFETTIWVVIIPLSVWASHKVIPLEKQGSVFIPFFIRTGKRLPTKVTEIVVNFKKNINIFGDLIEFNGKI